MPDRFSSFEIEAHPSCGYDYVDVRDGNTLQSSLLGRFCGNVVPGRLRSTGNSMLVNFVTDASVAFGGFIASYWTTYGKKLRMLHYIKFLYMYQIYTLMICSFNFHYIAYCIETAFLARDTKILGIFFPTTFTFYIYSSKQ